MQLLLRVKRLWRLTAVLMLSLLIAAPASGLTLFLFGGVLSFWVLFATSTYTGGWLYLWPLGSCLLLMLVVIGQMVGGLLRLWRVPDDYAGWRSVINLMQEFSRSFTEEPGWMCFFCVFFIGLGWPLLVIGALWATFVEEPGSPWNTKLKPWLRKLLRRPANCAC